MKLLVVGNSGSGKTTYARRISDAHQLPYLELDMIVWEPHQVAVARPIEAAHADLTAFIAANPTWVMEGCYGDLVELALPHCTELVFMNPGVEVCLANNRRRPYEPHKFDSPTDQEQKLPLPAHVARGVLHAQYAVLVRIPSTAVRYVCRAEADDRRPWNRPRFRLNGPGIWRPGQDPLYDHRR